MNEQQFMELYARDPAKALEAARRAGLDPKRIEGLILSTSPIDTTGAVSDATGVPTASPPPSGPPPEITAEQWRQALRAANIDRQNGFSEAEVDNNLLQAGYGVSYRGLVDMVKALPKQEPLTMTSRDVVQLMLSGLTLGAPESDFFRTIYPNRAARMDALREQNPVASGVAEMIGGALTGSVAGGLTKRAVSAAALKYLRGNIPKEIAQSVHHLDALIEARKTAGRIGSAVGGPVAGAITGASYGPNRETGGAIGTAAGTAIPLLARIPGIGGKLSQGALIASAMKYLTGK